MSRPSARRVPGGRWGGIRIELRGDRAEGIDLRASGVAGV